MEMPPLSHVSSNLQEWERYIDQRIQQWLSSTSASLPGIQHGKLASPSKGWNYVSFTKPFTSTPAVVAVQTARSASPQKQYLTPPQLSPPQIQAPQIQAPRIQAPQLAAIQIPTPSPPAQWGTYAKQTVDTWCSATIGQIPVIGGYLCQGVDNTFGLLAYYVFNAIQSIYYTLDWQAGAQAIAQSVEYAISQDINAVIAQIQSGINTAVDDVNTALQQAAADVQNGVNTVVNNTNSGLSQMTSAAQNAINKFYSILNDAIGLAEGLAIPVCQVSNVTPVGFSVYAPGGADIYWIAVSA
jgi:hypothetical protein